MDNKLYEGCKAMIIGAKPGTRYIEQIGKIVECKVYVPCEQDVRALGEIWICSSESKEGAWVVEGDSSMTATRLNGAQGPAGLGIMSARYLMPLPPLEDPGIDDCTFTPIKNQEPVAC